MLYMFSVVYFYSTNNAQSSPGTPAYWCQTFVKFPTVVPHTGWTA